MKVTIRELIDAGAKVSSQYFKFVPPDSYLVKNGTTISVLDTEKIITLSNKRIEQYRKHTRFAKKLYAKMIDKHSSVCKAIEILQRKRDGRSNNAASADQSG